MFGLDTIWIFGNKRSKLYFFMWLGSLHHSQSLNNASIIIKSKKIFDPHATLASTS